MLTQVIALNRCIVLFLTLYSSVLWAHGDHHTHKITQSTLEEIGPVMHANATVFAVLFTRHHASIHGYSCGGLSLQQAEHSFKVLKNLTQWDAFRINTTSALEQVVLCQGLRAQDKTIGGVAIPDKKMLLLDSRSSDQDLRHLFWHELWHLLESTISHDFVSNWSAEFGGYLRIYKESSPSSIVIGSGDQGYINRYGQSFAKEERAEIFAWFMRDKESLTTFLKESHDSILARKIYRMKMTLESLELR